MKVLIGCECSARVRDAFRRRGHDAWSCDLEPCEGDPAWHYQDDIFYVLENTGPWDLFIAHPECRFLALSGVQHLWLRPLMINRERWQQMEEGAAFFKRLWTWDKIPRRAVENSVMHDYAKYRGPGRDQDQIVQPWYFGDAKLKATALWLEQLPLLKPTHIIRPPHDWAPGEYAQWAEVHNANPGPDRSKFRARTYPGIAEAMAEQWGAL